jgi:hypothetical protein
MVLHLNMHGNRAQQGILGPAGKVAPRDQGHFGVANSSLLGTFCDDARCVVPLYEPVTADDTLSNYCLNLLSIIGLEATHPADAQRLRRARAGMRPPGPANVGLTESQILEARGAGRQVG